MLVSVLIPARNEAYLAKTILDVLANARGDVEVIPVCDGYRPIDLPTDPRVKPIYHEPKAHGMRPSINDAAMAARGQFLLKLDAHCAVAPGFDVELTKECDDDWVVTPKRFALEPTTWEVSGPAIEAHYLTYPLADPNLKHQALRGRPWHTRADARRDVLLDEDMSFQGSCWLMSMSQWVRLGGLSMEGYGPFVSEPQELSMKTWLGGGKVMINKRTWYAHWRKRTGQGYVLSARQSKEGTQYCVTHWMNNAWSERKHDIEWLIERFAPVPGWPDDWRARWDAAYAAGWPNVKEVA